MAILTMRDAINQCLHQEMERDETVVVIGEDVAGGAGSKGDTVEAIGGVFGVCTGLARKFGRERVIDTPISESAIVGGANGAALAGLRPVAELMFVDFIGVSFDQLLNQAAKFNYMFGGAKTPAVIRATMGAGMSAAAQHSQTCYAMLTGIPGLKVAVPSNAYDAKGLLASAIEGEDPVIFLEHKMLYGMTTEVPEARYTIPFGKGKLVREGEDVTIVAIARMVHFAAEVADKLAKEGIHCEVIDPRTTSPLDEELILESVRQTGRLVVVDESPPRCSVARDIAGLVAEQAFDYLDAPIKSVTAPHTPIPFAPNLELEYIPSKERIEAAVRAVMAAR